MPDVLLHAARSLRARISQNSVPDPLLLSALEDALGFAPEGDHGLRAGVLAQLACIPPHSLDVARSQEMSREAELLARRTSDPKILLDALLSRVGTLSGPSDVGTLLDVCWEVLHGYLSPSDLDRAEVNLALFYAFSLKLLRQRRDYCVDEIGRLARRLGQVERTWAFRRITATIAFNEGRFEEARAAFEELHADAQKLRLPYGDLHRTAYLIEWARARTGLHRIIDIGPQGVSEWHWAAFQPAFQAYRASALFGAGFVTEAKVVFEQLAASNFDTVPRELSMLCAFACLGETAIGFGDEARAETLYGLLLPFDGFGTPNRLGFHRGPVALHLGQLADFLGRSEAAVRHLECAVASSSQMGWLPDVVRSQVALARALDRASHAKSRRAKKLLAEARATASRLEMQPVLAEIDRLRLGEGRRGAGGGLRTASAY